jgi:ribose 5-phosphate isomerase B
MKIFIGSDHNGYDYKQALSKVLELAGHEVIDGGDVKLNPDDDFPQFAAKVVHALLDSRDSEAKGILVCGSGQGMCMAANRFKGIRASLCWDLNEARSARNDDNSNVLCLSARYTSLDDAKAIVTTFINTPFADAPRFSRRIEQLDQLT